MHPQRARLGGQPGGQLTHPNSGTFLPLASAPKNFFMTFRDIAFWIRSARADSRLSRLRLEHGNAAAFDELYGGMKDPFGAELPQYRYQQRKYDSLLSMLPQRPYRRALDIGCGLGSMTRKLAPFAEHILGTDVSGAAIGQAAKLSTEHSNIVYSQEDMLAETRQQSAFDLIVLADTLYYIDPLTDTRLKTIVDNVAAKLTPGGLLLLVNHYFFGIDKASRGTRKIHDAFRSAPSLDCAAEHRRAFFLATLLRRSN
jgi:SAM-dependent methyltransferase